MSRLRNISAIKSEPTVRRDEFLTLIECRLHKTPQDVSRIEELIGRRISLKADAVIAVSTSGFTKTARTKADAYGIHLRDFASLSREEIQSWGQKRSLRLNFREFTHVTLTLRVNDSPANEKPNLTDTNSQPVKPLLWRMLFQLIKFKAWTDCQRASYETSHKYHLRIRQSKPRYSLSTPSPATATCRCLPVWVDVQQNGSAA